MWSLICDNLSNILVLSLVLLAVGAAVTSMVLRKKRKTGLRLRLRLLPPWTRMSGTYLRPKAELPAPLTQGHMRYLLAIGRLHAEEGNGARITDISRVLKVSKPSAHRMARRLETLRLVEFAPRGRVYLTAKGCRVAECCQDRLAQLQGPGLPPPSAWRQNTPSRRRWRCWTACRSRIF